MNTKTGYNNPAWCRPLETFARRLARVGSKFDRFTDGAADFPLGLILPVMLFVSAASGMLVGLRVLWSGHYRWLFLVWNLFLAWLPLLLALVLARWEQRGTRRGWRTWCVGVGWLLFFPNAPYICTDLIHLTARHRGHFWVDLILILLFAINGLMLGFLSLNLVQRLVARRAGWLAGWLFAGVVAGLSGVGIYIGRFLRWNTWDVLVNPLGLTRDLAGWLGNPLENRVGLVFPPLFAVFLFLVYVMLYALTHLNARATDHSSRGMPMDRAVSEV